jgi:protein Mpv17
MFLRVSVEPLPPVLPESQEVHDDLIISVSEQNNSNNFTQNANGMVEVQTLPAGETDEQHMERARMGDDVEELTHLLAHDEIDLQPLLSPSVPVSYDENGMVYADAFVGIATTDTSMSVAIEEQDYPGFIKFLFQKDANGQTLASKLFNFTLLAVSFGFVFFSVFNIDKGMTRGWSPGEIGMRIPLDTWASYENSLSEKPVATKTIINVVIYLLGDWLSQTLFQKNNVLDFDAARTIKNGIVGMCFGPAVHEYYEFSDWILPVDGVTIGITNRAFKILMDQTIYLSVKCSIYIIAIGLLNGESLGTGSENVKNRIKPIMFAAWKFWPLVHCVTYGLIPARHRILWVNSVDLVWNAILASKARDDDPSGDDDEGENGIENLETKVGDSNLSWQDRFNNSILADSVEVEESDVVKDAAN